MVIMKKIKWFIIQERIIDSFDRYIKDVNMIDNNAARLWVDGMSIVQNVIDK